MRIYSIVLLSLILALTGCSSLGRNDAVEAIPGMSRLVIPSSLELVSIDGGGVENSAVLTDPYYHPVAPGSRIIEFKYREIWGNAISGELVSTEIYKLPLVMTADTDVVIGHSNAGRKSMPAAKKFVDNFALWGTMPDGSRIDGDYSRKGVGLFETLVNSVGGEPLPVPATEDAGVPQITDEADTVVVGTTAGAQNNAPALAQLKYWWSRADRDQRAEFLIWSTRQ